jgi:hypothetical protein
MVASGAMRTRLAMALAAFLLGGLAACDTGPVAPAELDGLLEIVPDEVAGRGLYYSRLDAGDGLGSVLPLRRAGEVFGVSVNEASALLESGGSPLTLLAGAVDVDAVIAAVERQGYLHEDTGEWAVFVRDPEAGADPLAAAVPAGAVREGILVLGEVSEVQEVASGGSPAVDEEPFGRLARVAGEDTTAIAFLPSPERIVRAAEERGGVGTLLAQADAQGTLPAWSAAALVWRAPAEDGTNGDVLLAYGEDVDGEEAARALGLRAATTPLLGEGRRYPVDLFERDAPRWDADVRVAALPVRWRDPDPGVVRPEVERGTLLFLAPDGL